MDINRLRDQTPGTRRVTHFNNAGASLMPAPVTEAQCRWLKEESRYGGYETAEKHESEISDIYRTAASFINASEDEIALMENATMAWNMAFFSIPFAEGDRILTSASEYASNYINYLKLREQKKVSVEVIPSDSTGQTDPEQLKSRLDDRVKLVSITHMPTNSGLINPVEKIGRIIQNHHCLYLVDACQSVGHCPVDVEKIGCDLLSTTGRKYLRGPRGTGFLYARRKGLAELSPPFLDLHAATWLDESRYSTRNDARQFENWEFNYAALIGLGEALRYADEVGIHNIWKRISRLAKQLRSKIKQIDGFTVRDIGQRQSGIVTFTAEQHSAETIKDKLADDQINVSISPKSSTLMDMKNRGLDQVVRASVHYYNTAEEIDRLATALKDLSSG